MNGTHQAKWNTLNVEQRGMLLAMTALGWDEMTPEEQMNNFNALVARAAAFEKVLL